MLEERKTGLRGLVLVLILDLCFLLPHFSLELEPELTVHHLGEAVLTPCSMITTGIDKTHSKEMTTGFFQKLTSSNSATATASSVIAVKCFAGYRGQKLQFE